MTDAQPAKLFDLLKSVGGVRNAAPESRLSHDLKIDGDDAHDLIEAVHKEFGTSFAGMEMRDFFLDEDPLAILFGFGRGKKKPLTVRHLLKVIENGAWFDPAN
jgi:hypothetical protein